jgi:hypothetical protein
MQNPGFLDHINLQLEILHDDVQHHHVIIYIYIIIYIYLDDQFFQNRGMSTDSPSPWVPMGNQRVSHPSTQAPRHSRAAGLGMQARLRKYRGREDSNLHQLEKPMKKGLKPIFSTNGLNIKYNQQTMYKHGEWENIC